MRWARDGFLAELFDLVLLVPMRSAQDERSVEDVMATYIGGEEAYKELMASAGRCLVIFEGLDEISTERQKTDKFLVGALKECTILEEAVILVTSRPHACQKLKAGRTVEIVGLGDSEIKQFAEKFFADTQTVEEFLLQLSQYPHIRSLCYVPMNFIMIADIFQVNEKKLPSTLTELYHFFVVMILQRQIKKETMENSSDMMTAIPAASEVMLCKVLKGIPKDAVKTVLALSRLAYGGFFDSNNIVEDPKIIFTTEDLTQCGIEVTADWDGYGLLKATPIHDVPTDFVTYNFAHLTIQEFLCALYMLTLSDQEHQCLLSEYFDAYPNLFIFFCGLAKVVSPATSSFVFEKLKSDNRTDVLTALRCVFETGETDPPQSVTPFPIDVSGNILQPYDLLCTGHMIEFFPVSMVNMGWCHIGDSGAEIFKKNCNCHVLQELNLIDNDLTKIGLKHIMEMLMKS